MINYFLYGGRNSRDFDLYISGEGTYDAPERDVELIDVPGRSGSLVRDNKRFKNITVKYPAFIATNFDKNFEAFRNFMLSIPGYRRLEDTYHPEEFRKALYTGPLSASMTAYLNAGSFDIEFNCMPQRFLKSGEKEITFTENRKIINPTAYPSKPLIRVYGSGTLAIGNQIVKVKENPFPYIDIDAEVMDAYMGAANANSFIELEGTDFPEIQPGESEVRLTGVSRIEIKPRWWII